MQSIPHEKTRSTETWVLWDYQHLTLYASALIYRMGSTQNWVRKRVDQIRACAIRNMPYPNTKTFRCTPSTTSEYRKRVHLALNQLCNIVVAWQDDKDALYANSYGVARSSARTIEQLALEAGVPHDQLLVVALAAYPGFYLKDDAQMTVIERERCDAALAAMEAGHYDVAHDIMTRPIVDSPHG